MIKHYTIPVFIPELGCPFRCIYCDQYKISGKVQKPEDEEIIAEIESHLNTFRKKNRRVELGFFGGNFTGLPKEDMLHYLALIQPYFKDGQIDAIRLSTRPDYIDRNILDILKRYHVETVELGAQSMDDEVLQLSGRGHTAEDTAKASGMIRKHGFRLGLQMMTGLPGDTLVKSKNTAKAFADLGAVDVRIYPALVIRGTYLETMYLEGAYRPQALDEAVSWSKELFLIFENAGIRIIRMGLHPSEGIAGGEDLVAGPFHPSFRELVLTDIWGEHLKNISLGRSEKVSISVSPSQFNYAIGYDAKNKKRLLKTFKYVTFLKDPGLSGRSYHVDYH
ncbi:MAG: radical SAM protein [Bacteroidetes bacterium]|nr:radical SAM protein [Bacteroidota bacterium]